MGNLVKRCCDDPPSKEEEEKSAKKPSHGKSSVVYPLNEMSKPQTFSAEQNAGIFSPDRRSPKAQKKDLKLQKCESNKPSKKKSPAKVLPSFLEDSAIFSSNTITIEAKGKSIEHYLNTPEKFRIDQDYKGAEINENDSLHDSSIAKIDRSFSRASGGSFNALNSSMNHERQKKNKKKKRPPMGMRKFFGDEYGLHTETTHSRKSNMSGLPTPTPPHNFSRGFFED